MIKILLLLLACGVLLAACTKKPAAPAQQPAAPEKPSQSQEPQMQPSDQLSNDPLDYVYRVTYTETDPEGNEYSIFAEKSYENARVHVTHPDGREQLFYVPVKVLYDLKDYSDREKLAEWPRVGPDTPDFDKDPQIRVSMMINNRSIAIGTHHMPEAAFIDKLYHIKELLMSYAAEDTEIPAFDVEIAGKTYHTVAGTGNLQGTGARIDFAGDKWWVVMGYTGRYESAEGDFLEITADGRVTVKAGDFTEEGAADDDYFWQTYATALGGRLSFAFTDGEESGDQLRAYMVGDPYPGTFTGFNLELTRVAH